MPWSKLRVNGIGHDKSVSVLTNGYPLPMSLPHLIYSAYPNWDGYARLQVFLISWVEEMLDVILDFKDHC